MQRWRGGGSVALIADADVAALDFYERGKADPAPNFWAWQTTYQGGFESTEVPDARGKHLRFRPPPTSELGNHGILFLFLMLWGSEWYV